MTFAPPFLYLPDALSLLLVWTAFVLLRGAAVEHLRIELAHLGADLREYWDTSGLRPEPRVTGAFDLLIDSVCRLAERIAPARLYFVRRCLRELSHGGPAYELPDLFANLEACIDALDDRRARERLRYLKLEL